MKFGSNTYAWYSGDVSEAFVIMATLSAESMSRYDFLFLENPSMLSSDKYLDQPGSRQCLNTLRGAFPGLCYT